VIFCTGFLPWRSQAPVLSGGFKPFQPLIEPKRDGRPGSGQFLVVLHHSRNGLGGRGESSSGPLAGRRVRLVKCAGSSAA
jgi:hypothetical protein